MHHRFTWRITQQARVWTDLFAAGFLAFGDHLQVVFVFVFEQLRENIDLPDRGGGNLEVRGHGSRLGDQRARRGRDPDDRRRRRHRPLAPLDDDLNLPRFGGHC